jgi:serine protease inhibitor
MPFSSTGLVGANTARRTTVKEYALGTPLIGNDNNTYVYVQAGGAIAAAATAVVSGAFAATSGAGNYTADTAFANGEYGWVRKTASPL